ncbi:MAG: PEP-CTERM sorting domain-containing protein [Pseudomonadales bacterium]
MANAATADYCAGDSDIAANPAAETAFVTTSFGDGFVYIGKDEDGSYDGNDALPGYSIVVTIGDEDSDYRFDYVVTVPAAMQGTSVDFVLGIKQSSNSFIAYLFEGVILGIEGQYNNFWINPKDKTVNAYSHASAWIRGSTTEVSEPGSLPLFGMGLLGLVLLRRRIARG